MKAVGESAIAALKTRPDYAITLRNALVGFIEIKAPGKGADPRRFRGHDKEQWEKLQSLPNLLYTDGNQFSLFRSGQLEGNVVFLKGDIETSGSSLKLRPNCSPCSTIFSGGSRSRRQARRNWQGSRPASVDCSATRSPSNWTSESPALTALAADWRKLLFPEANNAQFADGYAQAVTFGLLMARAGKSN